MAQSTNHQPRFLVANVRRVTAADFPVWLTPDGKPPTKTRKPKAAKAPTRRKTPT